MMAAGRANAVPGRSARLLLCLALIGGLVACTSGDESEQGDDRATVTFWYQPNGLYPEQIMLDELARFEDAHPGIRVEATMVGWDESLTKLATATRSGAGPDVAVVGSAWMPDLNVDGTFHEFGPDEVELLGGPDAFVPATWEAGYDGEGRLVAVPWIVVTRLLFYRSDLLADAGVDPGRDLADWESFEAALERLDRAGEAPPWGLPGRHDWNVVHNALAWIWAAGGAPIDGDGRVVSLTSSEARRGLSELQRLVASYGHSEALGWDDVEAQQGMIRGDYAMTISGSWFAQTLESDLEEGEWGVAPLPAGPSGSATLVGGSHLAVFADTPALEASLALVAHLTGPESQSRLAAAFSLLPARVDAVYEGREADAARQALVHASPYPAVPGWLEIEHALQRSFARMWASVETGEPLSEGELLVLLREADDEVAETLEQSAGEEGG